jgi:hypothetical protein
MVGTLVVNEQVLPIAGITLADGLIHFWVGPLPAPVQIPQSSEVRVHGPDGSLVLTGPWHLSDGELRKLAELRPGRDDATLDFTTKIDSVVGWPRSRPDDL